MRAEFYKNKKKLKILEMNRYLFKLILVIANLNSWTVCKMDMDENNNSPRMEKRMKSCGRTVENHGE